MTTDFIGRPVSRVDGRQKVTGRATYAAEFQLPRLAHGAIVRSTIARGRIARSTAWLRNAHPASWQGSSEKAKAVPANEQTPRQAAKKVSAKKATAKKAPAKKVAAKKAASAKKVAHRNGPDRRAG